MKKPDIDTEAKKIMVETETYSEMLDALMKAYRLRGLWVPDMETVSPEHEGEAEALLNMKRDIEQALTKAGVDKGIENLKEDSNE